MSDFIENNDQAETSQNQQNILDIEIVNKEDDNDDQNEEVEEDDIESENMEASIQLGFVQKEINPLFQESDWTTWDGGKVGGKPIWLDPEHIPNSSDLICESCKEPLCFLLEIYSPMDHIDQAFHRALYVFTCKKNTCLKSKGSMKVIRCQLPRQNKYYCWEPSDETEKDIVNEYHHLCELCGCKASNVCSACKNVWYCSRQHQKTDWKAHKKYCNSHIEKTLTSNNQNSFLFPEYEIIIEPEPSEEEAKKPVLEKPNIWDDAETPGGKDEEGDAKLTQQDYNQALSEQKYDPIYNSFLTRVERGGNNNQILRYVDSSIHRSDVEQDSISPEDINSGRLYLTTENKSHQLEVPPCPHCGAKRAFEFQIMPQLLHYLQVDKETTLREAKNDDNDPPIDEESQPTEDPNQPQKPKKPEIFNIQNTDLDWGSIDIFTCSANCSESIYLEEFAFLQELPVLI